MTLGKVIWHNTKNDKIQRQDSVQYPTIISDNYHYRTQEAQHQIRVEFIPEPNWHMHTQLKKKMNQF